MRNILHSFYADAFTIVLVDNGKGRSRRRSCSLLAVKTLTSSAISPLASESMQKNQISVLGANDEDIGSKTPKKSITREFSSIAAITALLVVLLDLWCTKLQNIIKILSIDVVFPVLMFGFPNSFLRRRAARVEHRVFH